MYKIFVKLQVLGLRLGVYFTFTLDNNDNDNQNDNHNDNHNDNNDNDNPHLHLIKGTVLGIKEQGLGIRSSVKGQGIRPKWSLTLKTKSCFIILSVKINLLLSDYEN